MSCSSASITDVCLSSASTILAMNDPKYVTNDLQNTVVAIWAANHSFKKSFGSNNREQIIARAQTLVDLCDDKVINALGKPSNLILMKKYALKVILNNTLRKENSYFRDFNFLLELGRDAYVRTMLYFQSKAMQKDSYKFNEEFLQDIDKFFKTLEEYRSINKSAVEDFEKLECNTLIKEQFEKLKQIVKLEEVKKDT